MEIDEIKEDSFSVTNKNYKIVQKSITILIADFDFSVVILCVRGTLVRKCMLSAHKLGMTKGEWVFLDVELVQVIIII